MPIDGIGRLAAISQQMAAQQQMAGVSDSERAARMNRGMQPANDRVTQANQRRASMELEIRLRVFRQSLSPAAASLLDQWLHMASENF